MKSIVVYRSKSGNTKAIAEVIAKKLKAKALPVNLLEKKGRGTKEEQQKEKEMFAAALEACKDADLVVIGTPVSFQQAHSQITRFCKQVETKNIGLFCTYINKPGASLDDLQTILRERGIKVTGTADFGGLNSGQFEKFDKAARDEYFNKAEEFVEGCLKRI
ncbi:NAD(P)H-dependent oxidoreductase [candidate division WOR-3 bacterium]|nr:NAD(P)H-dependent oxidoreductase [candidate division WOR-3 bacterium]